MTFQHAVDVPSIGWVDDPTHAPNQIRWVFDVFLVRMSNRDDNSAIIILKAKSSTVEKLGIGRTDERKQLFAQHC